MPKHSHNYKYKIGELCTLTKGVSATLKTEPGEYPLVVTAAFRRSSNNYQLEGPAVCVPLISSTGHGHAALHRVHYQEGRFALANLLVALRPKDPDLCDAKYLYHLLTAKKDDLFVPLMQGTANVSLKEDDIAGVEVSLPSLTEQQRIVGRVEELSAKIEEARRLRQKAIEEAVALIDSCLAARVRAMETQHGTRRLGELILDAGYGTSTKCDYKRSDNSVPVLRIPNVASEEVNFDNLKYGVLNAAELQRVLVEPGDIVVVRTNGSADLVGRCAVVPGLPEPMAFASYMIRINCDISAIFPNYLQLMLKHLRTNGELIDFARTTAGQYNISLGRLRAAQLPVPSLEIQHEVVRELDELRTKVDAVQKSQEETAVELNALMPSILSRAFSGQL